MRTRLLSGLLVLALCESPALLAQEGRAKPVAPADAIQRARKDVEKAKQRLVTRRKEVSAQRVALARQVARHTAEVKEKRKLLRGHRQSRDDSDVRLYELQAQLELLKQQTSSARSVLVEARRSLEAQLDLVDAERQAALFEELDRSLEGNGHDGEHVAVAAAKLLNLMARHVGDASRIRRSAGKAIAPDGRETEGTFVQIGGIQIFFAAKRSGEVVGIVRLAHGSTRPHVWPVRDPRAQDAIRAVAAGGGEAAPIDVTAGIALRTREASLTLLEQLKAGGVVMIPILAIAVLCTLVGCVKLVQLSTIRTNFDAPVARLLEFLRAGRVEEAEAFAGKASRPLRRLLEEGVEHRDASREDLEEMMHESILIEVPPLERYLSLLAVGAAVSPLLGLLGTVTGMISTFRLIAIFGTGDAKLLSGGISEALITTEAGLVVAIPLLLLHAFLSRRVRAITEGLEKSAIRFINTLKTREPSENGKAEEPTE